MVADAPPPSRSDEDAWCAALVERVAAGEAQALEELYDRYARPAYSLALRVTGDTTFAEEAVQEVFLAVWRQPERFQAGRGGFGTWLLAAVHHKGRRRGSAGGGSTTASARVAGRPGTGCLRPAGEPARGRSRGTDARRAGTPGAAGAAGVAA